MKSLKFVVLVALAALLVASPLAMAADLIKVKTGIVGAIDQLGTPVALEKGFFEKHGLDVTVANPFGTGVDELNALQAGDIQIAQVGVPMIGATLRGMDLVILGNYSGSAARIGSDDTMALVAREGSGIKTPKDLKGKRIATSFGTVNHLYLLGLLEKNGIDLKDVTLVNTPPADMPVALQAKGVDAFVGWDPFPILADKDIKGSYTVVRGGGYIGFMGYIVALRSWVQKNPDVVERFLAARAEADKWSRANPKGVAEVAVRWLSGTRPEIALEASQFNVKQIDIRLSAFNYQALDNGQKLLNHLGFLPGTIDVNKAFAPQYIYNVMKKYPDLFSDLAPIPASAAWKPGFEYKP